MVACAQAHVAQAMDCIVVLFPKVGKCLTRPQSLALYDGNGLGFLTKRLGAFPWSFALEAVLRTVEESGQMQSN